jgi:hypothetical protein
LNVAPIDDKRDDKKGSFYEELECVFSKCPTYCIKILLGDINGKWLGKILSNQQLGMKVYMKLVKIMQLKQ